MNLQYVITGTGRCGTVFMANLMTSLGFPCLHEAVFTTEGIEKAKKIIDDKEVPETSFISKKNILVDGNEIVAESSYMAAPFLKQLDQNIKVIHLVRNPIDVVQSFTGSAFDYFKNQEPTIEGHRSKFEKFMYETIPELGEEMSQFDRAFLYYVRWNQLIEKSGRVNLFHKIESGVENIKKFLNKQGKCHTKIENSISQKTKKIKIKDIRSDIRNELLDMMDRYKYKLIIF